MATPEAAAPPPMPPDMVAEEFVAAAAAALSLEVGIFWRRADNGPTATDWWAEGGGQNYHH